MWLNKTLAFNTVAITSEGRNFEVNIPSGHYEYAFYVLNPHLAKMNDIAEFLEIPLKDYVKMCFETPGFFSVIGKGLWPAGNKVLDFENDFMLRQNQNEILKLEAEQEQAYLENVKRAHQVNESEKNSKVRSIGGKDQILKNLDSETLLESGQRNAYEQSLMSGRFNLLRNFRLIFRGAGG